MHKSRCTTRQAILPTMVNYMPGGIVKFDKRSQSLVNYSSGTTRQATLVLQPNKISLRLLHVQPFKMSNTVLSLTWTTRYYFQQGTISLQFLSTRQNHLYSGHPCGPSGTCTRSPLNLRHSLGTMYSHLRLCQTPSPLRQAGLFPTPFHLQFQCLYSKRYLNHFRMIICLIIKESNFLPIQGTTFLLF